ncbi:MAG TPA: SusC/RagA family TonB-linked outer membrane protein [Gemmatimonas sp.]|nr:SusC/RagA family TonB-linked outer membrane protein [Gemmatimonas sp.]
MRRLIGRFSAVRLLLALSGFLALSLGISYDLSAQGNTGRIRGRVIGDGAGLPLQGVRVQLVGTTYITGTNAEGRYLFPTVPAGPQTVRVTFLGRAPQQKSVVVAAGVEGTVDFVLATTPIQLQSITTTATGEQDKRTLGVATSTIDAAKRVAEAPVANMTDMLTAQAPGVQVLGGAITGGGQRIRIRGTTSLSLNNEPIVFVDGVRVFSDNNSSSIGIGGTNPSRLSDFNPEEIESIEVLKGPTASTLYGTDAANGVIVIKTKRGKAGAPRWGVYVEQGVIEDRNRYPLAYRGWSSNIPGAAASTVNNVTQCFASQVGRGLCRQDSIPAFNLFADPDATPNGTGRRQQYGLNVSGGSDVVQYFLSGEWEDELGYLQMPKFSRDRILTARGTSALDEQLRPNALRKTSLRANVTAQLGTKMDVVSSVGFVTSNQRLPQTDNNTIGLLSNAFGGLGKADNGRFGYRLYTPETFFSNTNTQAVNRFIGSQQANYRPTSWLLVNGTAGMDFTSRNDSELCRNGECTDFSARSRTGYKTNNRTENFQYTGQLNAIATYNPFASLRSTTTIGAQYTRRKFARNGADGENLPPGATQAGAGAIQTVAEVQDEAKTIGAYVQQELGWRDKLFLTGSLRTDQSSAFGTDFQSQLYPGAQVSWILSEESFMPNPSWLDQVKLRAALGTAGTQPGTTDALRFFAAGTATADNADAPAVTFSALGNTALKPEVTRELEAGVEFAMFGNRLSIEGGFYDKSSFDALISRIVAPSVGAATTRFENIGEVQNRGWEALVRARLVDRSQFGWDFTFNGARNVNKLVDLGGTPTQVGATTRQIEGYPLDGYWQRRIDGWTDANNDGILVVGDLRVTDTAVYIGPSVPINEFSFINGFDFLKGKLRINTMVDYKGGHYLLNGTDRIRCESRNNCRGAVDPTAPLALQAAALAVREHPSRTQGGFMEKADFVRFRELSVVYRVGERWAGRLAKARSLDVVLSARNLGLWSDYTGIDPESNYFGGARGTVSDFQTAPPPSYFTIRFNLGY